MITDRLKLRDATSGIQNDSTHALREIPSPGRVGVLEKLVQLFIGVENRLRRHSATMSAVWVKCDVQSMYDYLAHRGAARDAWKLSNWEDYLATIDPDFDPPFPHYTVDNRLNSAVALADQAKDVALRMKNEV